MEEGWLSEPEGDPEEEDFSRLDRSPYEGDIPPWGQQGYAGYFPLEAKVFYITAYVGAEPKFMPPEGAPKAELKGKPVKTIGTVQSDVPYGSRYMMHRFAAIPVRKENLAHAGKIVDELSALVESTGMFGKIIVEDEFPDLPQGGGVMNLPDGKWFPVSGETGPWEGFRFVNAYSENRLYGGPEEGGWWYNAGTPVASIPVVEGDEQSEEAMKAYLQGEAGWSSEHPIGSVLGHDVFSIRVEDLFAASYPETTPHYE
jgi:hypothetical protein